MFQVCFTKSHNPNCTLLVYFLFRTISSPEDRLSCPQQIHTPHQSFERATGCRLAGRLADWPQTHPPSPVATATLVASLGSPPISRFFGWLVRSTQISGITFTASHRDTQILTHAHTHTLLHRDSHLPLLCWGICLGCCCCSLSSRIFSSLVSSYFTCAISTTTTCRSLFSNISNYLREDHFVAGGENNKH